MICVKNRVCLLFACAYRPGTEYAALKIVKGDDLSPVRHKTAVPYGAKEKETENSVSRSGCL